MEKSKEAFDKFIAEVIDTLRNYVWLVGIIVMIAFFTILDKL